MAKIKYYYPVYRHCESTYFRIKITAVGHLVDEDLNLLCGEQKIPKETFSSFTIETYAMPGRKICEKCIEKRDQLMWKPGKKEADLAKLKRWNDAAMLKT